jgi:hypothetical protein
MKHFQLKDWMYIELIVNKISPGKKDELKEWVQSYKDKWINCEVLV